MQMRIGDRPHLVVNKTDGGLPSNPSRTRSALLLNERPILAIIFGHAFGWNVSDSRLPVKAPIEVICSVSWMHAILGMLRI